VPCSLRLLLVVFGALVAQPGTRVGHVELFGTGGRDAGPVVAALNEVEGSAAPDSAAAQAAFIDRISRIVTERSGAPPTDVSAVCCDEEGNWTVYIGLAWSGVPAPRYRDAPHGSATLPAAIIEAHADVVRGMETAVRTQASEDHSRGYALSSEPALRRAQQLLHQRAVASVSDLYRVLEAASDPDQRAIAAFALGYAAVSEKQIAALSNASTDPDGDTRNNAVRALWVLAQSKQPLGRRISSEPFIALLTSGHWTDRNKGLLLVSALSVRRDPALLARLRREALDALIEMARWRVRGHSHPARMLLGRIAGVPERRLTEMVAAGDVDAIVAAVRTAR
jgi:hypothetical protein